MRTNKIVVTTLIALFLMSMSTLLVNADSRFKTETNEEDGYSFNYLSDMSGYDDEFSKDFSEYWKDTGRVWVWIKYNDECPENWSYDKVVDHIRAKGPKHTEIINGETVAVFERYQPDVRLPIYR